MTEVSEFRIVIREICIHIHSQLLNYIIICIIVEYELWKKFYLVMVLLINWMVRREVKQEIKLKGAYINKLVTPSYSNLYLFWLFGM